jgi:hypothetical protein
VSTPQSVFWLWLDVVTVATEEEQAHITIGNTMNASIKLNVFVHFMSDLKECFSINHSS